ncbi:MULTISPECIES: hypothetical protein [Nocardiaceae]|uniref:hypothetical protein n=1 Tax=Nocardiaceae TaxID=85025 RepID=UPI0006895610|nr:hypothetical protein [Rhodococcus fascians]AMY51852.1 Carboxylesterase B [Rhodococcus fascians D188]
MAHTTPTDLRPKDDERRRWPKPVMAAAAASVLLLTGCTGAAPNNDDSTNEVGLEQFMGQKLEFGACDASIVDSQPPVPEVVEAAKKAECAMLTVPMDYENLDGTTIEIAVSRISATGDNPIGSVLLNPGGPGAAGTTLAPLVDALWTGGPLPERFDIVGFDPRGVGLSRQSTATPMRSATPTHPCRLSASGPKNPRTPSSTNAPTAPEAQRYSPISGHGMSLATWMCSAPRSATTN